MLNLVDLTCRKSRLPLGDARSCVELNNSLPLNGSNVDPSDDPLLPLLVEPGRPPNKTRDALVEDKFWGEYDRPAAPLEKKLERSG